MEIKKSEFTIEGRKVPLDEIREKTIKQHCQYMRNYSEEDYESMSADAVVQRLKAINEYEENKNLNPIQLKALLKSYENCRHLLMWHDNSTVANYGHLACLVSVLYDPAVFLTNAEYTAKTGKTVDIQTQVEKPEVHFIARCKSSEEEQLAYTETRLACIQAMKTNKKTAKGNEIVDVLRFFHGDSPARQFESGQQKGGHYFCSNCGCHAQRTFVICHALNCPLVSLQDRINMVMTGRVARTNTLNLLRKPIQNLSRADLEKELASRGIYDGQTIKELKGLLEAEMKGIQRLPTLIMNNPEASLEEFGLEHYEILPVEPLHDVGHHIENVFSELPHHLSDKERKAMEDTRDMCLGSKDSKRGVDYRAALIKTAAFLNLNQLLSDKPWQILQTLSEMQRILYSSDDNRCPSQILRYYNQSWYHAILLNDLARPTKKLTMRKMIGVYYHDFTCHAGLMLRLISGQSSNAEEDERIFHHIKKITKQTTNYSPGHLVPNVFLRLQAEKEMNEQNDVVRQQSFITSLSKSLPEPTNTRFPISLIRRHSRHWQAHLQNISDFLTEGEGVWWHVDDDCIEFHDVTGHPSPEEHGPQLHHFRSSSMKQEEAFLNTCWNQCVQQNIQIPIHVIIIDKPDDTVEKRHTGFLGDEIQTTPATAVISEEEATETSDDRLFLGAGDDEITEETLGEEQVISIKPASDEIINISETDPLQTTMSSDDIKQPQSTAETTLPCANSRVPVQTQNYTLQSKLGKALAVVLGQTDQVERFDRRHVELKQSTKRNNRAEKQKLEDYKQDLAYLQTKVLAKNTEAKNCLLEWEKEQCIKNKSSPSSEQMKNDKTAGPLLSKLKYSEALLKQWKVQFS